MLLTLKQQKIISIFLVKGNLHSSDVYKEMSNDWKNISLVTIKRALSELTKAGILKISGSGRSTSYILSVKGRISADINTKQYIAIEPDKRYGLPGYNFELFKELPLDIFTDIELKNLETSTTEYKKRIKNLSPTIQKKELERLIVELSWKSSKIEGNTYTLLDTEKLILENKEASGRSRSETQMILNHKNAFNYIRAHPAKFKTVTRQNLQELHAILINNLNVNTGFRTNSVGVTGSIYRPLDNIYQITEAVNELCEVISLTKIPYLKALLVLIGISYIQPFEDGNKRTSRLMANALLMSHYLAPLSYRSVDEEDYRNAMLVFYELNSIIPIKKIFIEQYQFAATHYAIK